MRAHNSFDKAECEKKPVTQEYGILIRRIELTWRSVGLVVLITNFQRLDAPKGSSCSEP